MSIARAGSFPNSRWAGCVIYPILRCETAELRRIEPAFRPQPIADRVILMPQRAGTGPFAAFYVYDRLEGFMHGPTTQPDRESPTEKDGCSKA